MRKKKPNDSRSRSFTAANIHISERKPPAAPRKSAHARPEPSSGTLNFSPAAAILASCASLIRANFPLWQIPLLRHAPEALAGRSSALAAFRGRPSSGSPSLARAKGPPAVPWGQFLHMAAGASGRVSSSSLLSLFSVHACWHCSILRN